MKYVFRCDSSYKIGTGHLIRCLNLAKQLEGEVHFICRTLTGNLNVLVSENQFTLHEIHSIDIEPEALVEEINEITPILESLDADCIVVDHYGLGLDWETNAKEFCKRLLIIDDIEREHIEAGILDQNYRNSIPKKYKDSNSTLFLGPSYCLLNKDFQSFDINTKSNTKTNKVILFFGGSDPAAQTLRVTKLLIKSSLKYEWNLIVGSQNKDKEEIKSLIKNKEQFIYHENIDYMCKLMSKSYFFIGAGGSTSWERVKVELPSLCISIADNQIELAKNLHNQGSCLYLGAHTELSDSDILNAVTSTLSDQEKIMKMKESCKGLSIGTRVYELINFLTKNI
jgi:UDP-2,4-diacetamido-2,4,6-trideoxy-beta-L-altropyranose hydrolase